MKNTYYVQVNDYMTPVKIQLTETEANAVAYVLKEIAKVDPDALVEISDDHSGDALYDNYDEWIKTHNENNNTPKGETTMNLINELRTKSNNIEMIRQEVIEEIKAYFEEYLYSENLENQLKKRIGERQIAERKVCLIVDFWAYRSGCSSTYFHCGGKTWNNPENPKDYASQTYKGIELFDIQKEICVALRDKLVKRMSELGFKLIEDKDETSWLKYYKHLLYFGW